MSKVKVYISHCIQGQAGKDATHETMVANNNKAIAFVNILKENFPNVDFYCPGEHDEFVINAYEKKLLTVDNILDIDCQILSSRHLLLNYIPDQYISNGMWRENWYAQLNGIPILMATCVPEATDILQRQLHLMQVG